jgi:Tol biopolymer transport system component
MKAKVWARTSLPTLAVISSLLWLGSSSAQDLNGGSRQAQSPSIHPPTELTERVSLASTWLTSPGAEGNDASGVFWAFISANGRYAAFGSIASNLVDSDTNATGDVFVRDHNINKTERASLAWNGDQSNGFSGNSVAMTPAGDFVAFQSFASNLVSLDENGKTDVFVRDRRPGHEGTELISVASDESQADADSGYSYVSISDDGRYVLFDSTATNLVADDTNGVQDVFVRDRLTGTTARVSLSSTGTEGNDYSLSGHISGNGAFAVFSSAATNLTMEGMPGAFLRDLENHTTQFIGIGAANGLSQDGKYIVFESPMDDIVTGDTNGKRDVFIYDKDLDLF